MLFYLRISLFFLVTFWLTPTLLASAFYQKVFVKHMDGYRYELLMHPPDVDLPAEKGSYAKRLTVYRERSEFALFSYTITGNELRETQVQRDSFDLLHVNFDGVPDIRFSHQTGYTHLLSFSGSSSGVSFYFENQMSTLQTLTRDEVRQQVSGKVIAWMFESTYTFSGKNFDTLTIHRQSTYKPIRAEQAVYLNKQGTLTPLHQPVFLPACVQPKKEYGDYNFDGRCDLRVQETDSLREWNYFLFDSVSGGFKPDSFLNSLEWTHHDSVRGKFMGSVSTRVDELTYQTDYYEYTDGDFRVVRRQICHQKYHLAERSDCDIYIRKDGKLVFQEHIPGAE